MFRDGVLNMVYLDTIIYKALRKRMKVELFLCKDEEGGFGIKVDGKIISRNHPWEIFEYEEDEYCNTNVNKGKKKSLWEKW